MDLFVGRKDELAQLRAFVDVLASESFTEKATRAGRRVLGGGSRSMLISGTGGVGKSTLIGKFILLHVDNPAPQPLRFAYLDFDRSTLSAVQPATLLLALIRQIEW